MFDLLLRGGRVIDPDSNLDVKADIAFSDGHVAEIGSCLGTARSVQDVSGCIVAPGLIDLHTHVYWGATSISVDANSILHQNGTTTIVDAGSAGAGTFKGLRKFIIEQSLARILAFINVSFPGIYAYSPNVMIGECADLRLLSLNDCVSVIDKNRDIIVGIKVRVGSHASGARGLAPLEMAIELAEQTDLPVMAHIDNPPPSRKAVLSLLRRGDILTHCCKPFPNAPIRHDGRIWNEVAEARERGVIFDVGHGRASFGISVAKSMLDQGFIPDVISSDVHAMSIHGPAFGLLMTMSKFHHLGLELLPLLRCVTSAPASAMRRTDLGKLLPGSIGDATILEMEEGEYEFKDGEGKTLKSGIRFALRGIVIGGSWQRRDLGVPPRPERSVRP